MYDANVLLFGNLYREHGLMEKDRQKADLEKKKCKKKLGVVRNDQGTLGEIRVEDWKIANANWLMQSTCINIMFI